MGISTLNVIWLINDYWELLMITVKTKQSDYLLEKYELSNSPTINSSNVIVKSLRLLFYDKNLLLREQNVQPFIIYQSNYDYQESSLSFYKSLETSEIVSTELFSQVKYAIKILNMNYFSSDSNKSKGMSGLSSNVISSVVCIHFLNTVSNI